MKSLKILFVLVAVLLIGLPVASLAAKARNAGKLSYDFGGVRVSEMTPDQITGIITGARPALFDIEVTQLIQNPTSSTYKVDGLKLSILTLSGQQVLRQTKGLVKPVVIPAKSENTPLRLLFRLDPISLKKLIQENGGIATIAANRLTSEAYGISFQLVGTVETEGFELDINETISI